MERWWLLWMECTWTKYLAWDSPETSQWRCDAGYCEINPEWVNLSIGSCIPCFICYGLCIVPKPWVPWAIVLLWNIFIVMHFLGLMDLGEASVGFLYFLLNEGVWTILIQGNVLNFTFKKLLLQLGPGKFSFDIKEQWVYVLVFDVKSNNWK